MKKINNTRGHSLCQEITDDWIISREMMINQSQFNEHRDYSQVSVRLHDELEAVEEKRMKAEDEANRVKDYLKEVENSRAALQTELQNLHNEVNKALFHKRTIWSTKTMPSDEIKKLHNEVNRTLPHKLSYKSCIMRQTKIITQEPELKSHIMR